MGVFRDIFRLADAGIRQQNTTDWRENLRQSADLAEQLSNQPPASHGVSQANPFVNMTMYAGMLQGSGRVIALHSSGKDLDGVPIYAVELELSFPERAPYRAIYQTVIANEALHNWRAGATLPFRVSPDEPNALMLG